MRVSAHQPDLFPYAGYWQKVRAADLFVLAPTLRTIRSSSKGNFQSKQRMLGWDGVQHLSVPTGSEMGTEDFDHVPLDPDKRQGKLPWVEEHLLRIRLSYGWGAGYGTLDERADREERKIIEKTSAGERARRRSAPFFDDHYGAIERIYRSEGSSSLGRFNGSFIAYAACVSGIETPIITSRELGLEVPGWTEPGELVERLADHGAHRMPNGSDIDRVRSASEAPGRKLAATARLIRICQETGADTYLSGAGARAYAVDELFDSLGFKHEYFEPNSDPYVQLHSESFVPNQCALDSLFNRGRV